MLAPNGNAASANAFMNSLFQKCGEGDGFINLRFISPKGPVKNAWIKINEVMEKLPSILASYQEFNAFFGVAIRKENKGNKEGITKIPFLWLDLDSKKFDEERKNEFVVRFEKFPLKPSFVVESGGGLHLYWRLSTAASPEDIPKIEDVNKRLAAYFWADPAACEAARVMRLPGTRNLKYELKPEVKISQDYSDSGRSYALEDLDRVIPPLEIPPKERTGKLEAGWEKAFLEGVEEGQRNTALTKLVGRWATHGLSKGEVTDLARNWNEKNNPPLPDGEVLSTIESIWKKHLSRDAEKGGEDSARCSDYKLTTIREVFNYPDPSFLIDPILPEGTVSALGAYTGKGKSILMLSIAKAILTGKPLWGHFNVRKIGPVLLVDEETPGSFLKERLEKMQFHEDLPLSLLHFQHVRLDAIKSFEKLQKIVEEIKPALFVIDSLIRVHRRKEDDAAEMSRVMDALRRLANLGTTVLVIHHHRKGEGPIDQRLRGSSDIPGGIDLELSLIQKDGCFILSPGKTRTKPFESICLKLEANAEKIEFVYQGALLGKSDQVLDAVISLLRQRGEMGVSLIGNSLRGMKIRVGGKSFRSILSTASGKELVETPGCRGIKIYSLNPGWQFGNPKERESCQGGKDLD